MPDGGVRGLAGAPCRNPWSAASRAARRAALSGRPVRALVVLLALAGCSTAPEPPECVGEAVDGAQRLTDMVPGDLSGGGRAVASEIDMAATPPTADLGITAPSTGGTVRVDVSVGTTFEAEGATYDVVRVCAGGVDVVRRDA